MHKSPYFFPIEIKPKISKLKFRVEEIFNNPSNIISKLTLSPTMRYALVIKIMHERERGVWIINEIVN
jgi:hypothetical protein